MEKKRFIDIHSHIIFGADDGVSSLSEAVKVLKQDRDEGAAAVFATPHFGRENIFEPDAAMVRRNFEMLKERAAEEVPDRFCRAVPESGLLAGSVLAFDGFTGFTPVQYRLLEQRMAAARDMYVTVTMDEKQGIFDSFRQTDLFALSIETARTLMRIAQRQGISVAEQKRFGREEGAEERGRLRRPRRAHHHRQRAWLRHGRGRTLCR